MSIFQKSQQNYVVWFSVQLLPEWNTSNMYDYLPKCSENVESGLLGPFIDTSHGQNHIGDGNDDNDEIKSVPRVLQVRKEAIRGDFEDGFADEDVGEDGIPES